MLSDGTQLYGIPMATHTHVLYYNRNLVNEPPVTTDEVLERGQAGWCSGPKPQFH